MKAIPHKVYKGKHYRYRVVPTDLPEIWRIEQRHKWWPFWSKQVFDSYFTTIKTYTRLEWAYRDIMELIRRRATDPNRAALMIEWAILGGIVLLTLTFIYFDLQGTL